MARTIQRLGAPVSDTRSRLPVPASDGPRGTCSNINHSCSLSLPVPGHSIPASRWSLRRPTPNLKSSRLKTLTESRPNDPYTPSAQSSLECSRLAWYRPTAPLALVLRAHSSTHRPDHFIYAALGRLEHLTSTSRTTHTRPLLPQCFLGEPSLLLQRSTSLAQ